MTTYKPIDNFAENFVNESVSGFPVCDELLLQIQSNFVDEYTEAATRGVL